MKELYIGSCFETSSCVMTDEYVYGILIYGFYSN